MVCDARQHRECSCAGDCRRQPCDLGRFPKTSVPLFVPTVRDIIVVIACGSIMGLATMIVMEAVNLNHHYRMEDRT